jgi:hypothetical protein
MADPTPKDSSMPSEPLGPRSDTGQVGSLVSLQAAAQSAVGRQFVGADPAQEREDGIPGRSKVPADQYPVAAGFTGFAGSKRKTPPK